jgi:hypothetical protein
MVLLSEDGNDVIPFPRCLSSLHRPRRGDGAGGDLILLQHSLSLPSSTNSSSSTTTEIYRRANVRTPTETATRERVAGCLFLRHVVEMSETKQVIVVQTTDTIFSSKWLKEQSQKRTNHNNDVKQRMSVISVSQDTSGWDVEEDDVHQSSDHNPHTNNNNMDAPVPAPQPSSDYTISMSLDNNLDTLFRLMEEEIKRLVVDGHALSTAASGISKGRLDKHSTSVEDDNAGNVVIVMIESIVPLVMRHGWERVCFGLQDMLSNHPSVVMWIPVWTETCTSSQLMQLEDMAQAVLWMRRGDLHVLQKPRQGGKGGVLTRKTRRGIIPFDIHYHMERQEWELELLQQLPQQPLDVTPESNSNNVGSQHGYQHPPPSQPAALTTPSIQQPASATVNARSTKPILRLEEDDEDRKARQPTSSLVIPSSSSASSRPQIYLQDDDPEYDDLDEEDPDDDLDL